MTELWEVMQTHQQPTFVRAVLTHLELSFVALLLAALVALPAALFVSRWTAAAFAAVNLANTGRAVPSLAVLALALPLLGLGFRPALLALTVLVIPPILLNAVVGLRQVDPAVVDAALGLGMSRTQVLMKVRLPIAVPLLFGGIRTAAVQAVASATLATFVGGGGLGDFIVEGFQLNRPAVQLAGALPVAVLAVLVEVLFGRLQRRVTSRGMLLASSA